MKQETNADYFKRIINEVDCSTLENAVREFFILLDAKEESESGIEFNPTKVIIGEKENYVSSCRVLHSAKLKKILPAMRKFVK